MFEPGNDYLSHYSVIDSEIETSIGLGNYYIIDPIPVN